MYFQTVDNQVLSTQGQPDWVNLHRLTTPSPRREPNCLSTLVYWRKLRTQGFKLKALLYPFHNETLKPGGAFNVSSQGQLAPFHLGGAAVGLRSAVGPALFVVEGRQGRGDVGDHFEVPDSYSELRRNSGGDAQWLLPRTRADPHARGVTRCGGG